MKRIEELALGGGAGRGAFQFAFVRTLVENGYRFEHISGTSAGAVNAYLIGAELYETGEYIWKEEVPRLIGRLEKIGAAFRGIAQSESLFSNVRIWDLLQRFVFLDKLSIPITVYTVDSQGDVIGWDSRQFTNEDQFRKAIMGAAAIPGIFPAVDYVYALGGDHEWLVDAGIKAAVPPPQYPGQKRLVVTTKNDIEEPEPFNGGSWLQNFLRAFDEMLAEIARNDLQESDEVVNPITKLPPAFDFSAESVLLSYQIGVEQALNYIQKRPD